jgi:hypothetical protein
VGLTFNIIKGMILRIGFNMIRNYDFLFDKKKIVNCNHVFLYGMRLIMIIYDIALLVI